MPRSLARIHMHRIFRTKGRAPQIRDGVREALHRYMAVVPEDFGCTVDLIHPAENHAHLLFELGRAVALGRAVEEVKKSSSRWIKTQGGESAGFAWQAGYGAFAVSESNRAAVGRYIADQAEHHRARTFQEAYRACQVVIGFRMTNGMFEIEGDHGRPWPPAEWGRWGFCRRRSPRALFWAGARSPFQGYWRENVRWSRSQGGALGCS
ncbi:MAG: transposase [Isosphaeraceae bacterium]